MIDLEFRCWSTKVDKDMFDPDGWQNLIEECLSHLLYLNIRFYRHTSIISDNNLNDRFVQSDYWINRQPDFDINVTTNRVIFTHHQYDCFIYL